MNHLPIVHMTLYKHGVGYFRRRGPVSGEALSLTFRREEMDDLLKSLTVIDLGAGRVQGVDYDTPQSRAERLAGNSVILGDRRSMRDLLMALRGRRVKLQMSDNSSEQGVVVGLDEEGEKPLKRSLVSLLRDDSQMVMTFPLERLEGVELHDETAAADLRFFLKTALGQETHRSITIRLSPGDHDLEVSYIAPAPTWRVSYRLVADDAEAEQPEALLQGWGIFDNRLEEDLDEISLSLTAGMPISFIYDLYTPHTPERPVVKEEDRTAAAPVMFEAATQAPEMGARSLTASASAPQAAPAGGSQLKRVSSRRTAADMEASVESAATGQDMGELFQYNVGVPVTVGRGQSAMVPIVSSRLKFKKDLIYNGRKMPTHPVATIRFDNSSGLTLERGPVTVLEAGEYVGEAVLPFTTNQAEAVISYAVELGIHVKETLHTERQLQSLDIKDKYLVQNVYDIRRLTYAVDNRTAQAKMVLIEHQTPESFSLFETPEPAEKTLETNRYRVEAPPNQIAELTVQERCLRAQRQELRSLDYRALERYLANKFLDKQTYNELKALLDAWAEIGAWQQQIKAQEQQRQTIYQAQEQAQKNMTVLSNQGEEGKLRGRYVQQLTDSEEALAEIERTIAGLQSRIKQKQAEIAQMMNDLGREKR